MWQLDGSCFEFPLLWWYMPYSKSLCVVVSIKFCSAVRTWSDVICNLFIIDELSYVFVHVLLFIAYLVWLASSCGCCFFGCCSFVFWFSSSSSSSFSILRYINIHLLCCLYFLLLLKSGRSDIYFLCPLSWRLKQVEFIVIILFPTLLSAYKRENGKCNSYGKIRSLLMIWFNNKRWKHCKLLHH